MYQNEFHPQRWKKALTNQSKPESLEDLLNRASMFQDQRSIPPKNSWGAADCCSATATEICLARSKASGSWAGTSIAACMHTACAYGADAPAWSCAENAL